MQRNRSVSLYAIPLPAALIKASIGTTGSSHVQSSMLALRGGAAAVAATAFNAANESYKLAAIGGYSVISTLTLNASLRLFTSTELQPDTCKVDNFIGILFTVFCATTIISGAFTSIVFTLLTLYSKVRKEIIKNIDISSISFVEFMFEFLLLFYLPGCC